MANQGDRIVDPLKVVLPENYVLLEVFKKESSIIIPIDGNSEAVPEITVDYTRIVAKGSKVDLYDIGDIVLDIDKFQLVGWETRGRNFIKVPANNIKLAVKEDNFLVEEEKNSIIIN